MRLCMCISIYLLYYTEIKKCDIYFNFFNVFFHVASVLPIDEIALWAHNFGAKVLVDACQSVPHMVVDVQKLDADFLVASSHKVRLFLLY